MQKGWSRRAFLSFEPPAHSRECHISSLLVQVRPEHQDKVAALISGLAGAELASAPVPGKLVVTLETPTTFEIVKRLDAIHDMPGVVAASLIYHQWEPAEAENEADHGSHPPELSQG